MRSEFVIGVFATMLACYEAVFKVIEKYSSFSDPGLERILASDHFCRRAKQHHNFVVSPGKNGSKLCI